MDICTFWYGPRLREVDRICLASMVLTGQKVKLFAFDEVENLPPSVELHDASQILDRKYFQRIRPGFPDVPKQTRVIVQFSDIFRIALMKHRQGVWLDTDVYLTRQFHPAADRPFVGRENFFRVGVSALYFPSDSPVIDEFYNFIDGTDVLPSWLGLRRGVLRPAWFRLTGRVVAPATVGITVFGNDGISALAKRYGFFRSAAPKQNFYYWTGRNALRIYDPAYGLEPLQHPDFIGFHIHKKGPSGEPPAEGSFYHWAVQRVRHLL